MCVSQDGGIMKRRQQQFSRAKVTERMRAPSTVYPRNPSNLQRCPRTTKLMASLTAALYSSCSRRQRFLYHEDYVMAMTDAQLAFAALFVR